LKIFHDPWYLCNQGGKRGIQSYSYSSYE
jgi:hypothetical protein